MSGDLQKTFYLETFGCQMNFHDSEKVIGTLLQQGYRQVESVEQAGLILYNTCSIRDKAHRRVFHRLADYRKLAAEGKRFGVLGCVAQQEGERIFERAPHVSLVCGSASYRRLPEMLAQLEASSASAGIASYPAKTAQGGAPTIGDISIGNPRNSGLGTQDAKLIRITGLDDRQTDKCFETEFTARSNPHSGYITIMEGCDKFCAYCVVPFTRGKERSRTSDSILSEARQMADLGYTEIQLLGQNVNSYKDPGANGSTGRLSAGKTGGGKTFAELLAAVGEIPGIRRVRFITSHPRDFGRDIVEAIDAVPALCDQVHLPVQSGSTRVLSAMQRLYTREQYLERVAWIRAAKRDIAITTDAMVGFPGESESDFAETLSLLDEVGFDGVFAFKYSPRPNTPALGLEDAIPGEEKARRLEVLLTKQREIQTIRHRKYLGTTCEVMVEGYNPTRSQWIGRTSQNKIVNFTVANEAAPGSGSYLRVLVTGSFPNSLGGESVI
jgi:tRNA-2-methylthio-N6-dimethylallyladenosine synthase